MKRKNIALIIAGGIGQRMGMEIPKQFIVIDGKPVIIYTLEAFQKHPDIDAIFVVCVDGWHETLWSYANKYQITKLQGVVTGGENGQASIRNGVMKVAEVYDENDIILVHDAIRPMVSQEIISDCIAKCRIYGSAITVIPCVEAMLLTNDQISAEKNINRDELKRTQTPQAFPIGKLKWAHETAIKKGITNSTASCTLMIELGEKVFFSVGSEKNIKLTTQDDLDIFKALLMIQKSHEF